MSKLLSLQRLEFEVFLIKMGIEAKISKYTAKSLLPRNWWSSYEYESENPLYVEMDKDVRTKNKELVQLEEDYMYKETEPKKIAMNLMLNGIVFYGGMALFMASNFMNNTTRNIAFYSGGIAGATSLIKGIWDAKRYEIIARLLKISRKRLARE